MMTTNDQKLGVLFLDDGTILSLVDMVLIAIQECGITAQDLDTIVYDQAKHDMNGNVEEADALARQLKQRGLEAQIRFLIFEDSPYYGYITLIWTLAKVADERGQ
jgi:hypothetical protein